MTITDTILRTGVTRGLFREGRNEQAMRLLSALRQDSLYETWISPRPVF